MAALNSNMYVLPLRQHFRVANCMRNVAGVAGRTYLKEFEQP